MFKKIVRNTLQLFSANNKSSVSYQIFKGSNVDIHPTSNLITVRNGKICLEGNNYIGKYVEIGTGGEVSIGFNTSIQDRCIILEDVEIGRHCLLAHNIYISSGKHYFDFKPEFYIKDQDALVSQDAELASKHSKKVIIGDDCWIGASVVIMSGVTIGRGCVIGANSVVTKDVEPFSVIAGSPAKIIKKRLDFEPKKFISFGNEMDLPNFYNGFLCDLSNKEKYKKENGIACFKHFSAYLSDEGTELSITLKKLHSTQLQLKYNNQIKGINSADFQEINFQLQKCNYHEFEVVSNDQLNEEVLIVSKIEIK
jgi:acetyltransferase-like isoleucine patch superfamily enzyme